ncbi:hypothetical protein FISHEDRAFT_77268 [Fistulina hepatica ATCC 64428]|uniref:Uncharacterized protein n=1 Tax=Fistulina hepatica ATCC 64428 TaxID=1128425 RepID=A0A0D7A1M9_9AGAR|nr:hypothetical protein FISHEDRAFT_77268 [Fistulina hepatica ATCC 64428]
MSTSPKFFSRRKHRKRFSVTHLSVDTTATLPEYIQVPEDEQPPDYPSSAEDADEETDSEDQDIVVRRSVLTPPISAPLQRRSPPRRNPYRRRQSTDAHLDSLLERSVHALEMSNTLLQSSMSTNTSLSNFFGPDATSRDDILEARAIGLSRRIHRTGNVQTSWADDLEEISRGVDDLLSNMDSGVSCSLPSLTTSPLRQPQHEEVHRHAQDSRTGLRFAYQPRIALISPPPRALTQYIASDDHSIALPSTLGLRASSSTHSSPSQQRSPQERQEAVLSLPETPAHSKLAAFIADAPPAPSAKPGLLRRRSDGGTRFHYSTPSLLDSVSHDGGLRRTRSQTPQRPLVQTPTVKRTMTPPQEEASLCSGSSSEGVHAHLTVSSLRKILHNQPEVQKPVTRSTHQEVRSPPRPRFPFPVSPAIPPDAGMSHATASISRLFTKGMHTASKQKLSPRVSAFKGAAKAKAREEAKGKGKAVEDAEPSDATAERLGIPAGTSMAKTFHSRTPSMLSIPDMVGVALSQHNTPNASGRSTPRGSLRISFAELPESYSSTTKKRVKKRTRKKSEDDDLSWWQTWFGGGMMNLGTDAGALVDERIGGRGRLGIDDPWIG